MDTRQNQDSTTKMLRELTPLEKHVKRFTNSEWDFSPTTVSEGLEKIHSSSSSAKGAMISTFNATHSSLHCPALSGNFTKDPDEDFGRFLHMGTMRFWNRDGSDNKDRWEKFKKFVKENQNGDDSIVWLSTANLYLTECYNNDPPEHDTGRNADSITSSKPVQGFAATAAWDEVFDRCACDYRKIEGSSSYEPCIKTSKMRQFIDDSDSAFQDTEDQKLPAPKPF